MTKKERKAATARRYFLKNREKILSAQRISRAANPEKYRAADRRYGAKRRGADPEKYQAAKREEYAASGRKRNTGFTPEMFESALAKQKGKCALCSCDLSLLPSRHVHADHDHTTGDPRGVLCQRCNHALGLLKDSLENLTRAIHYLKNPPALKGERHEAITALQPTHRGEA